MMEGSNDKQRIQEVEFEKNKLIEEAKKINKRLHYKTLELKALQPFITDNRHIRAGPHRKELRMLEFKVSTQAYTPKIERELLKKIKEVRKNLDESMKVEQARKKVTLVEQDLVEINKRKEEIDIQLSKIREEMNSLRDKIKKKREERQQQPQQKQKKEYQKQNTSKYLSLEDIVEIHGKE